MLEITDAKSSAGNVLIDYLDKAGLPQKATITFQSTVDDVIKLLDQIEAEKLQRIEDERVKGEAAEKLAGEIRERIPDIKLALELQK